MCYEMLHDLIVDEGVEDLGDDGEEGYGSVEAGESAVFLFEEFYGFCYFKWVWVGVFADGLVVELSEDGSEEVFEVSDDGWFDFVDIAGFVGVDFLHDLYGVFFCNGLEFEWRMSGAWWVLSDAFFCFQLDWNGLTGLFSDCDEEDMQKSNKIRK